MNIQLINALRNRNLFNVKVLDTFIEGDCLQVLFADKEGQWVLTNLITPEEVANKTVKRVRQIMRAYAL
nr:MAG TPA: hypothetical protein [Bacteriophage sp.]